MEIALSILELLWLGITFEVMFLLEASWLWKLLQLGCVSLVVVWYRLGTAA